MLIVFALRKSAVFRDCEDLGRTVRLRRKPLNRADLCGAEPRARGLQGYRCTDRTDRKYKATFSPPPLPPASAGGRGALAALVAPLARRGGRGGRWQRPCEFPILLALGSGDAFCRHAERSWGVR